MIDRYLTLCYYIGAGDYYCSHINKEQIIIQDNTEGA